MAGKSPVAANDERRAALQLLARSRDRSEADRARAVLLTLSGWTSRHIADAFGVREDTVRLWRADFARDGIAALKTRPQPGPPPVKAEAALRVVTPLLDAPGADRPNWTLARLIGEIEARERVTISRSRLSKVLRKKVPLAAAAAQPEGPPGCRRRRSRRARAGAAHGAGRGRRHRGSLFADESAALTHPYLARAWARQGADLRVPAPGQAKKSLPPRRREWPSSLPSITPPAG